MFPLKFACLSTEYYLIINRGGEQLNKSIILINKNISAKVCK